MADCKKTKDCVDLPPSKVLITDPKTGQARFKGDMRSAIIWIRNNIRPEHQQKMIDEIESKKPLGDQL